MKVLAYSFSVILHPVIIPLLTLFLLIQLDPFLTELIPPRGQWRILLAVGITTGLLPALSVFILSKAELVESVELKGRKERILPFIMTLFYFIATYILLMKTSLPSIIYSALLGGIVALSGMILLTLFKRVSAHLCAYGTLMGTLAGLYIRSPFPFLELAILMVLLGGLLASSRVVLGAHSLSELLIGVLWGFTACFVFVSLDIHYVNHGLLN